MHINGEPLEEKKSPDGYVSVKRTWNPGDKVELDLTLEPRVVVGNHSNQGKLAILYGPLVLAADEALLGGKAKGLNTVAVVSADRRALAVTPEAAPRGFKTWPGAEVFRLHAVDGATGSPLDIRLVPFAAAGATGKNYKVWLPLRAP